MNSGSFKTWAALSVPIYYETAEFIYRQQKPKLSYFEINAVVILGYELTVSSKGLKS